MEKVAKYQDTLEALEFCRVISHSEMTLENIVCSINMYVYSAWDNDDYGNGEKKKQPI